jgi:hypothetical protein
MPSSEVRPQVDAALEKYPAIDRLFGPLIRLRCGAIDPRSFLLDQLLSSATNTLNLWEERSASFGDAVVDVDAAAQKIFVEGQGHARGDTPRQFDARLKDLFLEVSVVSELASRGVSSFTPLPPNKKKTYDFGCVVHGDDGRTYDACLEVKNLRSPLGITDAFVAARRTLAVSQPNMSRIDIVVTHHWDKTLSDDQTAAINSLVEGLSESDIPTQRRLQLEGVDQSTIDIKVTLKWGQGRVVQTRPIGGSYPTGPFIFEDRLFDKAISTIERAAQQLAQCPAGMRLLALNFDTPDAMLSSDLAIRLQKYVHERWADSLNLVLFLHYGFLEGSPTASGDHHV